MEISPGQLCFPNSTLRLCASAVRKFFGFPVCFLLLCQVAQAAQPASPASDPTAAKPRTRAEVEALISKAGTTPPDWWASTPLNYPPTLDLTWQKPPPKTPWTPSKYLGQYIWGVINENPGKWKEGARLLHHTLEVNKNDRNKLIESMYSLGTVYRNLLQDYARAAFWWRKAGAADWDWSEPIGLADCYWKLGCKEMAQEALTKYGSDDTYYCRVVKLWADMGEVDTALKVAEEKAREDKDTAFMAWLMSGEACRMAGRYKEALAFYGKVAVLPGDKGGLKQCRERARASTEAIKVYDLLDLKRIPDGTYTSNSIGYAGQMFVAVTVKGGRIEAVKVTRHQEKQPYASLTETPRRIIEKQSVKGIDTFSSATVTSEAIINATAKALSSGMK